MAVTHSFKAGLLNKHLNKINMNKIIQPLSQSLFLLAVGSFFSYSCQQSASSTTQEETMKSNRIYHVSENDTANMALVTNYYNSLIGGDGSEAAALVATNFMSYGPSVGDSATIDQVKTQWAGNAANRTKQDAGILIGNGLTVTEGPFKGDWVSMWGTYKANDNKTGKDISVPWHSTSKIENGKILTHRIWFDNLAPAMELGTVVRAK